MRFHFSWVTFPVSLNIVYYILSLSYIYYVFAVQSDALDPAELIKRLNTI